MAGGLLRKISHGAIHKGLLGNCDLSDWLVIDVS